MKGVVVVGYPHFKIKTGGRRETKTQNENEVPQLQLSVSPAHGVDRAVPVLSLRMHAMHIAHSCTSIEKRKATALG